MVQGNRGRRTIRIKAGRKAREQGIAEAGKWGGITIRISTYGKVREEKKIEGARKSQTILQGGGGI